MATVTSELLEINDLCVGGVWVICLGGRWSHHRGFPTRLSDRLGIPDAGNPDVTIITKVTTITKVIIMTKVT
jgi:hypothetical protein